jgi:hypothetical protein
MHGNTLQLTCYLVARVAKIAITRYSEINLSNPDQTIK